MPLFRPQRPSKDWIPPRELQSQAPKWSGEWWLEQLGDLLELIGYVCPI
jgi:hypothetical protein